MAYEAVLKDNFSPSNFVKGIFLSQVSNSSDNILFATTTDVAEQNVIDARVKNTYADVSLEECKTLNFSDEELLE